MNCTLWFSFGWFVIDDFFIYAPNLLGLASGFTQMALFAKYGFHAEELAAEPAVEANPKAEEGAKKE